MNQRTSKGKIPVFDASTPQKQLFVDLKFLRINISDISDILQKDINKISQKNLAIWISNINACANDFAGLRIEITTLLEKHLSKENKNAT